MGKDKGPKKSDGNRPSLLEAQARGGANAEGGFTFQENVVLSRIPGWLAHDGFTRMIREATGDTEASFFAPGKGFVRELLEAKNHSLAPSEFWSEIDRFRALDSGSPGTFHWFTLASAGLSEDLKPLANGLRRVRDPYGFYDSGSAIRENSYQDFAAVVEKLGRGADDARFIFEKVLIDWELGTAQGHGEALFREALPTRLPEFGHLSSMMLHDAYLGVVALLRSRLNKPIERREIEAVIRSPIPADRLPPVRPVSLNTSSDIGEAGPSSAIRLEWAPFFGGVARDYPGPDEWERRVMRELRETKEWIQAHRATRRVKLTGNRRLSASLAIGSVFSAVAGFAIEMEYRGGELWGTDAHPEADTPSYPLDVQGPTGSSDELIVCVGILRDVAADVSAYAERCGLAGLPVLNVKGSEPIVSAEHANQAVRGIKDAMTAAIAATGCRTVHLFFAGPAHLALFLGHRLNATASIQCYEWVSAGRYVPTCLLFGGDRIRDEQP